MTKQIKATTNKLHLTYNNHTTYTIPRVEGFKVSEDGTQVSGSYTKSVEFHGIKQKHNIDFSIDLKDVVEIGYEGKEGEINKQYTVSNGRILTVTEWRTEKDYYKKSAEQLIVESYMNHLIDLHKQSK